MVRHIFDSWDWIVARCCHMLPLVANDEVAEIKKLKTKAVNDDMSGLRARFRFHASIYLRHCRGSAFGLCLCETGWRLGPRTVANAFYVCVLLNMFERQICEFDLAMISQSQCM